jgi:hypothetical protein
MAPGAGWVSRLASGLCGKVKRKWKAGPAGENQPKKVLKKILKTFLFPILIQLQI